MPLQKTFRLNNKTRIDLHRMDCLEGLADIADGTVSAVVTSPPYNLGINYSHYDDTIPREEYLRWMDQWAREIARVLSPEGSLFLNVGSAPKDPWIAMDVARHVANHLVLQNTFHWVKAISIDSEHVRRYFPGATTMSLGHYKPINSNRFVNDCHEYIFHFSKNGTVRLDRKAIGVPYQDKSNIRRWNHAGTDLRCRGNTWFIPYNTILSRRKDRPHPATFPEKLVENCLKIHGIRNITQVVDPFMGLGTTAMICADMKLNCIGFEIDNDYFQEACRRLTQRQSASIPGL